MGIEGTTSYFYKIMSLLEGVSVGEHLADGQDKNLEGLHAISGETFGKLHQITRLYDGWVSMQTPYLLDWKSAFFNSLDNRIHKATTNNNTVREALGMIQKFIVGKKDSWVDPKDFVLSDIDGFQAMAKFENNIWNITGIIDVEDHHFTDQRFVLAGYELSLRYEGRKAPETFWKAYKQQKHIDPSFSSLKSLFELYYLLSWLPMIYEEDWRGKPEDKQRVIKHFEDLIHQTIKSAETI